MTLNIKLVKVMACRSEVDYLLNPNHLSHRGHKCAVCGTAVVVTTEGRGQIERGEVDAILCNPCALEYVKLVQERGKLAGVVANPAAVEQVASGNQTPVANWIRSYVATREGSQ